MATLKLLESALVEFRKRDLDRNGLQDFWTGDISGLHRYGLIDRALAHADARPLTPLTVRPIPNHGYYFLAMDVDDSGETPVDYRQDTDGKSGKVHHQSKYGLCAYPAKYGLTGRPTFILNEGGTIFMGDSHWAPVLHFPNDYGLKLNWSKPQ